MITNRVYILNEIFDTSHNKICKIEGKYINHHNYKFRTYNITKKTYKNIIQEITNNNTITYCEFFELLQNKNKKLIVKHTKDILDNLEFPPLNKYDFEETFEEHEYNTKYGKIISNKYHTYLILNDEYLNNNDINEIF